MTSTVSTVVTRIMESLTMIAALGQNTMEKLAPQKEVMKVFGAAPSLTVMKKMNKTKTIF